MITLSKDREFIWLKVLAQDDQEFTRNIRNQNNHYFHSNIGELTEEAHYAWFVKELVTKPERFHIIMLSGGTKIGTISVDVDTNTKMGIIGNVLLDSEHRGLGYGKQAMYIAMGLAVSRGAKLLRLSVEWHNDPARNFYEKLGFSKKAIIMEKKV